MTDLLQGLIRKSFDLNPVFINGGWLELDSIEDYNLYKKLYFFVYIFLTKCKNEIKTVLLLLLFFFVFFFFYNWQKHVRF